MVKLNGSEPSHKYVKVSLKKELMETIRQFIHDYPEFGYRSLAQFVEDAVRRRVETLEACHRLARARIKLPKKKS